jgi:hypothetical protein
MVFKAVFHIETHRSILTFLKAVISFLYCSRNKEMRPFFILHTQVIAFPKKKGFLVRFSNGLLCLFVPVSLRAEESEGNLDNILDSLCDDDWTANEEDSKWTASEEADEMLQQGGTGRPGKLNEETTEETTLAELLEAADLEDPNFRLERSEIQTRRPGRSEIQVGRPGRSEIQTRRPGRSEIQTRRPGRSEIQTRRPGRSEIQTRRPGRSEIQTRRPGRSEIQTRRPGRSEIQTRRPGRSEIQTRRPGRSIILPKVLQL